MPKISVPAGTFPDIVVAYLFDKMLHPDKVTPGNEDFNKLVDQLKRKGFLSLIRKYYLSTDANDRMKYKIIKDIFTEDASSNTMIQIRPEKIEEPDDEKVKGIIKKVMKKLISSKEFNDEEISLIVEIFQEDL